MVKDCFTAAADKDELEHLRDVISTMMSVEKVYMKDKEHGFIGTRNVTCLDNEGINRIRRRTCNWMYMVVDFYNYERETATIAMSFYDCYNLKKKYTNWFNNRSRLGAISSLYLAVKLNESKVKDPICQFTSLGDDFSKQDIINMESELLFALSWKMHPPTPQAFIRNFFQLFDYSIPRGYVSEVYTLANYITELSAFNFELLFVNSSIVGFASIMLALQQTNHRIFHTNLDDMLRQLHYYDFDVSSVLHTFANMNQMLHSTLKRTGHQETNNRCSRSIITINALLSKAREGKEYGYVSSDDDNE